MSREQGRHGPPRDEQILLDISSIWNYNEPMSTGKIIAVISSIRGLAHELITGELKKRGVTDIAPSHGDILFALYFGDGMSMKDISARIGKKKNTVTVLTDKLLSLGYIRKEPDRVDKRTTRVFLTEKGRAFQEVFTCVSDTLLEKTYRDFREDEKAELTGLLARIQNNLR